MRAILTAIFAGLLPVAGVTTVVAVDATREPTEVVTASTVTTTTTETPVVTLTNYQMYVAKESLPTTTLPDLTGVDWVGLARDTHGKCGEWRELALLVGWPVEEWPTMSYVIHRESRCNIDSWNRTDPASGSRGLMQINGSWCRPNKWNPHPAGWLGALGILTSCEDLFIPEINLRAGLAIWLYGEERYGCGWRGPWATPCA